MDEEKGEVKLNLTPLIDCVFLLLVFFMVTTVLSGAKRLHIVLPKARHYTQVKEKKLSLLISKDGEMEINGRTVTMDQLVDVLLQEKKRSQFVTLIIEADKESLHGYTLDAMAAAKAAGIAKISMATEKEKKEKKIVKVGT